MSARIAFVLALAALLAGCGSSAHDTVVVRRPTLPRALATHWRAESDAVAAALAAHDGCLAQERVVRLRTSVIEAIDKRRVASRFQEPLLSAVNELASRITCVPPPAPTPAAPAPTPAAPHGPHGPHGPKPRDHGHGHGQRDGGDGGGD
jgi:hypothetical protein